MIKNLIIKAKQSFHKYHPMKVVYLIMNPRKDQQLYIHIGMPKTGSSAIQAFLALNEEYLKNNDCAYPNHQGFLQAFQTSAGNARELDVWIKNHNTKIFNRFLTKIRTKKVILSSELLYSKLRDCPEKFASFFANYNIKIICYIRDMGDLAESCSNQLIKNHNVVDYTNFENNIKGFNYYECLIRATQHINIDKIIVKKYEKNGFYQGNIYADFMQILDLELDDSVNYPEKFVNPSLCRDALEFRMIFNKSLYDKKDVKLKYALNSVLAKYSVEKYKDSHSKEKFLLINPNMRSVIKEKYQKIENKFLSLFFPNTDSQLFQKKPIKYKKYNGLSIEKISEIFRFIKTHDNTLYASLLDFTYNELADKKDKQKILTATKLR
ncbi:MAG: hypothetical protein AB8B80_04985 [Marinicellaceae bacterium]